MTSSEIMPDVDDAPLVVVPLPIGVKEVHEPLSGA